MNSTDFNWGDTTIDSRDIISRYEELQDEYISLFEAVEAAEEDLNEFILETTGPLSFKVKEDESSLANLKDEVQDAKENLQDFVTSDDMGEFEQLKEIVKQGEDSPDWSYGETLIHETYFTQYIKEVIDDCYEMPKDLNSGVWPWNHVEMDWDAAAEEAKQDYTTIEADGETYYIKA